MEYAKHLIERIVSAPDNDRVGVLANELLREFQLGYPLDDLHRLLQQTDEHLLATAVWISSELGVGCRPLLPIVVPLLTHPQKRIRFFALDCLLWTLPENGCDLARALRLLNDPEDGIRWKVLDLLFRISREQLKATNLCPQTEIPDPSQRDGLGWLMSSDSLDFDQIEGRLKSPNAAFRKFGVIAAAHARRVYPELLVFASTLDDADVREFAKHISLAAAP
jgi:hypothetical protein